MFRPSFIFIFSSSCCCQRHVTPKMMWWKWTALQVRKCFLPREEKESCARLIWKLKGEWGRRWEEVGGGKEKGVREEEGGLMWRWCEEGLLWSTCSSMTSDVWYWLANHYPDIVHLLFSDLISADVINYLPLSININRYNLICTVRGRSCLHPEAIF